MVHLVVSHAAERIFGLTRVRPKKLYHWKADPLSDLVTAFVRSEPAHGSRYAILSGAAKCAFPAGSEVSECGFSIDLLRRPDTIKAVTLGVAHGR